MAVTPANPEYTEEDLLYQLTDSGAKAIITIPDLLPVAVAAGRKANIPSERIVLFKSDHDKYRHYTSLLSKKYAENTEGKIKPTDLAFLAYSSGTTGLAKGVMLTHGNIVANILQLATMDSAEMHWTEDRMASFLPLFHI